MDVSKYRAEYAQQLEQAAEQREVYRGFIDKSKPLPQRRALLEESVALGGQDETAQAVSIIQDKDEDDDLRAATLYGLGIEVGQSHDLIDLVIGLMKDSDEPLAVRKAALRVLQQSSFRAAVFNPKRPEYLAALRELLDDKEASLREMALEILAQEKDEYAQRRLLEGLQSRSKALVRPAKAIQLLGYDIHAEYYPILREMVKNPPSKAARQEAIRLLASDPGSKEMLSNILQDKNESETVRNISAVALQSLAPAEFEEAAKQIVRDNDESNALQATSISALSHFGDEESLGKDAAFSKRVEQLGKNTRSKEVGRAAAGYKSRQSKGKK